MVGRDTQAAAIARFLAGRGAPCVLVIRGESGIGKTFLWEAAVAQARRSGVRVLSAAPGEAEADLSFAGLGDLLAGAAEDGVGALPRPQRRTLEAALLLRDPGGAAPDGRAVAVAVLGALRALAAAGPVVVAVDDAQWLDRPSAAALGYALRRIADVPVRALVTQRTEPDGRPPLGLDRASLARLDLGPLGLEATRDMLAECLDAPLPRPLVRRIHERTHGNPLYALELARGLQSAGWTAAAPDAFTAPADVAALAQSRLLRLPRSVRSTLLYVAALSQPTLEVVRAARPSHAGADVEQAIAAGLLRLDGTRLRFVHPLFASACYQLASPRERRQAHARLAEVVGDPERRARQLALATPEPSHAVAAVLDAGARAARARGAPDAAAELAELARRLTPPADVAAARERAQAVARHLVEAGEPALAREALEALVAETPPGPQRVRPLLTLAAILYEHAGPPAAVAAAERAMGEAGDDGRLRAEARLALATLAPEAGESRLAHARAALAFFEADPETEPAVLAAALREAALAGWYLGRGISRHLMDRAIALEARLPDPPAVAWRAATVLGECLKYVDQLDEAGALLAAGQELAEREGDLGSLAEILGHRAELTLWLGDWPRAAELAARGVATARDSGQGGRLAIASYHVALVAAHRGPVAVAEAAGEAALDAARAAGDRWAEALAGSALGFLALSRGDAAAAVERLGRVDAYAAEAIRAEPRQWRHLADYVEALVATGELARARDRLARLERWAAAARTDTPMGAAARSRAIVADAGGERAGALDALAVALEHHRRLPMERARTLLTTGAVQRRARRQRAARASLEEAVATFAQLGAPLWERRARDELARIGGRAPAGAVLTAAEQRVAELVAEGRSNKEVAAALVVTPRTIEAHLTRIYAKLGVRSRAALARQLR